MSDRGAFFSALVLLVLMGTLGFLSLRQDSLTFDELAHIPAGYSYLALKDYRINPEHPPLAKDLAAFPLLFLNPAFPEDSPNWTQEDGPPKWYVQFDLGREFLYESGNDPREIILASRLPMLGLLLAMGAFLFWWARRLAGNWAAVGVLFLFALSPSFLAHGRLVTTDVAAAFGALVAFFFWLKFLQRPDFAATAAAGLAVAFALLLKFSLLLLIPTFGILAVLYPLLHKRSVVKYLALSLLAGVVGAVVLVWPVEQWHVSEYPAERQVRDTVFDLRDTPSAFAPATNFAVWAADVPGLRPFAQYLRGVLMASTRTTFGNTVYFLGEVTAGGWWYYFPVVYALKAPLALHLLGLLAGISGLLYGIRRSKNNVVSWARGNTEVLAFLLFLLVYWGAAMAGNLNIGVRHLLPTLPFAYLLVLFGIKTLVKKRAAFLPLVLLLFAWYGASSLLAFPNYIPYFNELGGGVDSGYKHAVDSNYDWGQDFAKLAAFVEERGIEKLSLDYFGGESPSWWLGDRVRTFNPREEQPTGWVAVSVNQLQGGLGDPTPAYTAEPYYYQWLAGKEPVRIGKTIFLYNIPAE